MSISIFLLKRVRWGLVIAIAATAPPLLVSKALLAQPHSSTDRTVRMGDRIFLKVDGETDVRKYVPVEKLRALASAPVVNPNVDTSLPMLPPVGA